MRTLARPAVHLARPTRVLLVTVSLCALFFLSGLMLGKGKEDLKAKVLRDMAGSDVDMSKRFEPTSFDLSKVKCPADACVPLTLMGIASATSAGASLDDLVALRPRTVSLCHPTWHGIRSATYAFGDPVLEVPQVNSVSHAARLVHLLVDRMNVSLVVLHGLPPGMIEFAAYLKMRAPAVRINVVYHGKLLATEEDPDVLDQVLAAARQGMVDTIGFVKKGLAPTFALSGIKTFELWNVPRANPNLSLRVHSTPSHLRPIHVGVFGWNLAHKNLMPQLMALCFHRGVVIHVQDLNNLDFSRQCYAKFVEHNLVPHESFLNVLAQMDVNMYVSLTEAFPMTVLESMTAGVPCLTSPTSAIFDNDKILRDALVVTELENPEAIAVAVVNVLARKHELVPRMKLYVNWLYHKALYEWDEFKRLSGIVSSSSSASPSLKQQADESLAVVKAFHLIDDEGDRATSAALSLTRMELRANSPEFGRLQDRSIAFVTYELAGVSAGGAGVVIASMAEALLDQGYQVHILAQMDADALATWHRSLGKHRHFGSLFAHHLPTVIRGHTVVPSKSEFVQRSREFALGLGLLHRQHPFERVEVFEYAGVGYELLRQRLADVALSSFTYLPASVIISARIHGSLQLIDQGERFIGPLVPRDVKQMYLMEQYCLATADVLLAPSSATLDLYAAVYSLDKSRMAVAPPPMQHILAAASQKTLTTTTITTTTAKGDRCAPEGFSSPKTTFVVLGRLQMVKGIEHVVRAAVSLLLLDPSSIDVVFYGSDVKSSVHNRMASEYLKSLIPTYAMHQHILFCPPLQRSELRRVVAHSRAAIVASEFEAFNLVAHELAHLRVPLVISDIPAFRQYFSADNAFTFAAGDVASLQAALLKALRDDDKIAQIRAAASPAIAYGDPIRPYDELVPFMPRSAFDWKQTANLLGLLEHALAEYQ